MARRVERSGGADVGVRLGAVEGDLADRGLAVHQAGEDVVRLVSQRRDHAEAGDGDAADGHCPAAAAVPFSATSRSTLSTMAWTVALRRAAPPSCGTRMLN